MFLEDVHDDPNCHVDLPAHVLDGPLFRREGCSGGGKGPAKHRGRHHRGSYGDF